jgi:hypothetical protein
MENIEKCMVKAEREIRGKRLQRLSYAEHSRIDFHTNPKRKRGLCSSLTLRVSIKLKA